MAALTPACAGDGQAVASSTTVTIPSTATVSPPPTTPVGEGRPFPSELLPPECAAATIRDPAVFEVILLAAPTLAELCAAVGPPDGTAGSGLFIVVYDLIDGSHVLASYEGPFGTDRLMGATRVGPDGQERPLGS